MTKFCRGVVNETYERYLFNIRTQSESESIDEFYGALLALSKNCSFGDLTSSLIKDRIIVGMQNNATRQKRLSEKGLTLEKCIEIARSYEATRIRMKAMQDKGDTETVSEVQKPNHKFNQDRRDRRKTSQSTHEGKPKHPSKKCYFFGRDYHKRQSCPAANSTCNNCGKKGHFQAVCKSSKAVREVLNDEPSSLSENNPFLGAIHNAKRSNKEWSIEVCLDNTRINFKIDTGADVDIISDKIYTSPFCHQPRTSRSQIESTCQY